MNEPYRVAREIDGIGFKTADRIAINLGFANDAPPRLDAGLIYALETLQEEGHTAFREADLSTTPPSCSRPSNRSARRGAHRRARRRIRRSSSSATGPARRRRSPARLRLIQLPHNDRAEQKIAGVVARLTRVASGLPPIKVDAAVEWAQEKAGFTFHELQRTACATRSRTSSASSPAAPARARPRSCARSSKS
jgi:exodeoxyribonuclease V alpha subunit